MEELRALFGDGGRWLSGAIGAVMTGIGMIAAGWFRYRGITATLESESEKLAREQLAGMADRLEEQLLAERMHCEHMMNGQAERFNRALAERDQRIEARDRIISEMRIEAESMRARMTHLEKRMERGES